ncbi:hypothetical protein TanjilG_10026 [Lupinus angustifolius]|uniref:Pectinesterase n=1 Tax=Lupinus angustifolius TaxID=3871 RepID=A0A1J7GKJ7_LUPAN|nr:PREDICTED: pectinesterase 2-like [Lupinus angustifolius]OIW00948.1 hypothetical protein TanjilG_10026 [Lupinus angustifolius]
MLSTMVLFRLLITLLIVPFLFSSIVSGYSLSDIKKWCSQTPNPKPCEYYLSDNAFNKPIKNKSDFLKVSLQIALDQAQKGQENAHSLGPKCRNSKERAVWADCLELYEYTVQRLNQTINPNTKFIEVDAQTWLSTALTNLETCKDGFNDLGVSDNVLPLLSNNVTKLISNVLSLNKVPDQQQSYKDGFPTWVKPRDGKLLRSYAIAQANVVVAKDGSGKYKTVKEAIDGAPQSSNDRYVIYVKKGTYNEQIVIKAKNIMLVGDGIGKTIITGSKSVEGGSTTFNSATVAAEGYGFMAQYMTFRNTATTTQAVALRSGSDNSVFYKCGFEGYQDTLYVHSQRQFYRECDIYGTVDFIFGNAAVVLQNCNLYARNGYQNTVTVTAQGRTDPNQNTGIIIHNSKFKGAPGFKSKSVKSYLGRPWKEYSRTVFLKTYLDSLINPAGWMEWDGNFALNTLYYAEYANTGPGSSTKNRVKWRGYEVITSASKAEPFTVGKFLDGNSWLPATGVPFTSGL